MRTFRKAGVKKVSADKYLRRILGSAKVPRHKSGGIRTMYPT